MPFNVLLSLLLATKSRQKKGSDISARVLGGKDVFVCWFE